MLGKRADVARKDLPKPDLAEVKDRSGLTPLDWALIKLDNCMRDVNAAAETAAACNRKLAKLDGLLDDPALAAAYPDDHPERQEALQRHFALHHERNRAKQDFRRAAKSAAAAWDALPDGHGGEWPEAYGVGWSDAALWWLALPDAGLNRLAFWQRALVAWKTTREGGQS